MKYLLMCVLALFCVSATANCQEKIKKADLRVLYVGGQPDWGVAEGTDPVKARMDAFENMLKKYFTSVTVINANEYTQQMSSNYDVTVMDGTPKQIAPEYINQETRLWLKAGYFTEDFDQPILTIGSLSDAMGRRVGTKNDWYCLCLDAYAHSWRKNHQIFKGPFNVKLDVENRPTPEEALKNVAPGDAPLPANIPMWRVQTKGYSTDAGFPIGLVSRPGGYEDSPECEYISGGVSQKSIDAVAIGRHGNWFHWGFAASPAYMTKEAQDVFANAIVYISKFKGQGIIARKYSEGIADRHAIGVFKSMVSEEGYKQMVATTDLANKTMEENSKKAKEKQAKGEKLSEEETYYLNFQPMKVPSREEMLQRYLPKYYAMFGTDEQAYIKYFDENADYFYDGNGSGELELDEDAKSLGIRNDDIRLIDEAIKMLETDRETAKAKRILTRYTLVDFPTAAQWREWFNKNSNKMFFTQSGGWIWLINSREPGVNDYKVWENRRALGKITNGETDKNHPVAVAGKLMPLQSGESAIYIEIKTHPGYHIYSHVSPQDPYIVTEIDIKLPEGYAKVGDMQLPASRIYNTKGTAIWEGTVVLKQIISGQSNGKIECKIKYQSCANDVCLPPMEATLTL